jgi:hypothetical protein
MLYSMPAPVGLVISTVPVGNRQVGWVRVVMIVPGEPRAAVIVTACVDSQVGSAMKRALTV